MFLNVLSKNVQANEIVGAIKEGVSPILLQSSTQGGKSHVCAYTHAQTGKPIIYVAADYKEAAAVFNDLCFFLKDRAYYYPERDFIYSDIEGRSYEWDLKRLGALSGFLKDSGVMVTTIQALMQYCPPKELFTQKIINLKIGMELTPDTLIKGLLDMGYKSAETVEGEGQFSKRGGIVDFYSPSDEYPARVEFFGDFVDSIRLFDPLTQRTQKSIKDITAIPVREVSLGVKGTNDLIEKIDSLILKYSKKKGFEGAIAGLRVDREKLDAGGTLPSIDRYLSLIYDKKPPLVFDIVHQDTVFFLSNENGLISVGEGFSLLRDEEATGMMEKGSLVEEMLPLGPSYADVVNMLRDRTVVKCEGFLSTSRDFAPKKIIELKSRPAPKLEGNFGRVKETVLEYLKSGYTCILICQSEGRRERLKSLLKENSIPAVDFLGSAAFKKNTVYLTVGSLNESEDLYGQKTVLLSENTSAGARRRKKTGGYEAGEKIRSYADLMPGDYIVHQNYGIGIFDSIQKIETQGVTKDYIKIRFDKSDALYVPCNQLDLISKHIVPQETKIKLSRLGGSDWAKTKSKAKAAVRNMAKELIELYSARLKIEGHAFEPDSELQRDFESRFVYEETEDQRRSSEEIKRDMEKPVPMDRLLLGDVGFGKTEVALRAVFKCVLEGMQAAILVPTTILSKQHYETVSERFCDYPVNIAMLSRFVSGQKQKEIIRKLKTGEIDIVIGTHRLIQKDVSFKNLGLVVVDEEQRFGVMHKEKLKELTKTVDCLTLSATPIPRTLNLAMSGIRDMSVIEEAPSGRQEIQSYVMEYNPAVISEAINREMRRGGQVFYLHNRIETIEKAAADVKALCPGCTVDYAHGQMREKELTAVMDRFIGGETDVLVCTTIIESGIDIANVNTLIINNADNFGLAQLYQIRGRVGRSNRRAYAYFLYQKGKVVSEVAQKRLSAIKEFTEFGSGFKIAMRDLEIRGSGNILGTAQHGHMMSVGYDMYMKLLNQAVNEELGRGGAAEEKTECAVDILIDAYIPHDYVPSYSGRIEMYKKIAAISEFYTKEDVRAELCDRYGLPPIPVENLIEIAALRNRAGALKIKEITQRGDMVVFIVSELSSEAIFEISQNYKRRKLKFLGDDKPGFSLYKKEEEDSIQFITGLLDTIDLQKEKAVL